MSRYNTVRVLGTALLTSLSLTTTAFAVPNQPECVEEDCSLAKLTTLRAIASRGNEQTSFSLGHIFMNPESGVKTDLENAFFYFHMSAKQGFLPAYRQTAGMLAQGAGTEKNMSEAKQFMKMAADEGVNRAAEEYAVLVFSDKASTDSERDTAIAFLEAEVEKSMSSYLANYLLAILHIDGKFIEKDIERAQSLLAFPASGEYANSVELLKQLSDEAIPSTTANKPQQTAGLNNNIETITVTGISENMVDIHSLMLDEFSRHHGQTGSRIKGNGCKKGDPYCVILDGNDNKHRTFWQIDTN